MAKKPTTNGKTVNSKYFSKERKAEQTKPNQVRKRIVSPSLLPDPSA